MKKRVLLALAALPVLGFAGTNDPALDMMLQKMIEKGVMPGEEAQDFAEEMKKAVGERNKMLKPKGIEVKSKVKKLEFSGTHYLGFTMASPDKTDASTDKSAGFEFRRNYLQVKAYLNDKDYMRVTLDTTKELTSSKTYAETFVKYAYVWLETPFKDMLGIEHMGAEFGVAHRPWIDYEEHNGWFYRSINKVALEHKTTATEHGPDLINSADLGFNLKYKSPFFSSEVGMFNGEGYHADKAAANQKNSTDLSLEWRLTGHLFGNGEKVGKYDRTTEEYASVSFYGMRSSNHKDNNIVVDDAGEYDREIMGLHAVYNNPMFLIAGQWFTAEDKFQHASTKKEIEGYSINGELRPMKDVTILARYDAHEKKENGAVKEDATQMMYGVAYKMNSNLTWIASAKTIEDDKAQQLNTLKSDGTFDKYAAPKSVYMLTAEVKW